MWKIDCYHSLLWCIEEQMDIFVRLIKKGLSRNTRKSRVPDSRARKASLKHCLWGWETNRAQISLTCGWAGSRPRCDPDAVLEMGRHLIPRLLGARYRQWQEFLPPRAPWRLGLRKMMAKRWCHRAWLVQHGWETSGEGSGVKWGTEGPFKSWSTVLQWPPQLPMGQSVLNIVHAAPLPHWQVLGVSNVT